MRDPRNFEIFKSLNCCSFCLYCVTACFLSLTVLSR